MSRKFWVKTIGTQSDIIYLIIPGSLDTVSAYHLQEEIEALIRQGFFKYIIDLGEAKYISSAGIQIFSFLHKHTRDTHEGGIILTNIPPRIYRLFTQIGIHEMLRMTETVAQALEMFEPNEQQYQN